MIEIGDIKYEKTASGVKYYIGDREILEMDSRVVNVPIDAIQSRDGPWGIDRMLQIVALMVKEDPSILQ
ncbi:MAG: hypothetical protein ACUVXI_00335 [bacterium]